jgi:hypothetical protein
MNRLKLGLAAGLVLLVGVIVALQQPEGGAAFAGACIRVGMILAALWLAWPQIARYWGQTPRWLLIAAAVALVICVIHPMYALAAVPILALLWFLGPRVMSFWKKAGPTSVANSSHADDSQTAATTAPPRRPRRRSNAR